MASKVYKKQTTSSHLRTKISHIVLNKITYKEYINDPCRDSVAKQRTLIVSAFVALNYGL